MRLRGSTTRFGHKAWFVDDDQGGEKRGYYIQTGTGSGHWLRFNDTEKFVEIETAGGQKILINDIDGSISIKANKKIDNSAMDSISSKARSINTTAMASISSNAASINNTAMASISSKAASINTTAMANISMTAGAAINMTAAGTVTITAPMILMNGLVKINGLIPMLLPA